MPTLCARPPAFQVDFATSRFIVSKTCGVDVGEHVYGYGEELPQGVLSERALRQIYEPPMSRIETVDYVRESPDMQELREACARSSVSLSPPAPSAKVFCPNLNELSREDLVELCRENGLNPYGNTRQLRNRLAAALA